MVVDAVARLLDGALGDAGQAVQDSFGAMACLDCPHYTRSVEHALRCRSVGLRQHAGIVKDRRRQQVAGPDMAATDLLDEAVLSKADRGPAGRLRTRYLQALDEPDGDALSGQCRAAGRLRLTPARRKNAP